MGWHYWGLTLGSTNQRAKDLYWTLDRVLIERVGPRLAHSAVLGLSDGEPVEVGAWTFAPEGLAVNGKLRDKAIAWLEIGDVITDRGNVIVRGHDGKYLAEQSYATFNAPFAAQMVRACQAEVGV